MATSGCIFGKVLETVRKDNKRSRAQVAREALTNSSDVKKIEKGNREPRVLLAIRLARSSGMELGDFFRLVYQEMRGEER